MISNTYRQLNVLSNDDLLMVCREATKLVKERGLFVGKAPKRIKIKEPPAGKIDFDEYLKEDWSHLFNGKFDDSKKYYVYMHIDPRVKRFSDADLSGKGMPFYIGKGCGSRVYSKRRSKPHLAQINDILNAGYDFSDIAVIYKDDLDEKSAFILESKLINYFGCRCEIQKLASCYISGRKNGILLNSDFGIRPRWISDKISELKSMRSQSLKKL